MSDENDISTYFSDRVKFEQKLYWLGAVLDSLKTSQSSDTDKELVQNFNNKMELLTLTYRTKPELASDVIRAIQVTLNTLLDYDHIDLVYSSLHTLAKEPLPKATRANDYSDYQGMLAGCLRDVLEAGGEERAIQECVRIVSDKNQSILGRAAQTYIDGLAHERISLEDFEKAHMPRHKPS